MNIIITAPSLDVRTNVSGISTVVNTIIASNTKHRYFHYLLGRPDSVNTLKYAFVFIKQLIVFPFFLKKNHIDIVHQNLPFNKRGLLRETVISFWCYATRTPVILHIHGGEFLMNTKPDFISSRLANWIFRKSREKVVLSDIERGVMQSIHRQENVTVLPNTIQANRFTENERSYNYSVPVFLFIGRIHESKGIEDLVKAFAELKKTVDFRFLLCGTGPLQQHCVEEFAKLLGSDFEFRGVVSGQEKTKAFKDADFFLLPSRYGEGLPMALLEAMAVGLVPVVTDDASMKHVVQPYINGLRVNKNDPDDIVHKLKEVIPQKDLVARLSEAAKKTVREEYDVNKYINRLNSIYASAVNKDLASRR